MKRNPLLYLSVLFTSFFLGACDLDTNLQPIGNWTMSDPVPKPIGDIIVLDEEQPESVQTFEWEPAVTSNRFIVGYRFLLVEAGSTDFSDAIMEVIPGNSGRALSVSPKASEINYALWAACYPSGEAVDLEWVVVAKAIEKETIGRLPI